MTDDKSNEDVREELGIIYINTVVKVNRRNGQSTWNGYLKTVTPRRCININRRLKDDTDVR
jgi:hypothetical protein